MQPENTPLFSVGHSNHDLARFLALLRGAGITAIADVRSSPSSRRLLHFNRGELEPALREQGIAYVFLGDLLGGRPPAEELYDEEDGQFIVNYERVRATPAFRRGLERLLRGQERYTLAMMCSEADPLDCHRGLMIAPALKELGVLPLHLRKDGTAESTAEFEERLLRETKIGAGLLGGLFPPSEEEYREMLVEAYRAMNRRKAFRVERGSEEE
jgi:uncharacterized protein (DUF488 family)